MIERVRRGIRYPFRVPRKVNTTCHRAFRGTPDGIDFFTEDWDNLLILDACRADAFREVWGTQNVTEVQSPAASTPEFVDEVLDGRCFDDVVYVTANPQVFEQRKRGEVSVEFHAEYNVWKDGGWDDENNTVLPETMVDSVIEAVDAHPNKRIVAHFMQPHTPYLGETAENEFYRSGYGFLDHVKRGAVDVNDETLWTAYCETLALAKTSIDGLLNDLNGKTVVTADHGELLGERTYPIPITEYGHQRGLYHPKLTTIPWFTSTNGARKDIVSGDTSTETDAGETVHERLEAFGYLD